MSTHLLVAMASHARMPNVEIVEIKEIAKQDDEDSMEFLLTVPSPTGTSRASVLEVPAVRVTSSIRTNRGCNANHRKLLLCRSVEPQLRPSATHWAQGSIWGTDRA